MTCKTVSFYCKNYVDTVECINDKILTETSTKYVEVDARGKKKEKSRSEM